MDSLRLSDAERESAVELLSEQYALGRLTKDEFDERSDAVWSARTQGDLAPLFADLPAPPRPGRRGRPGLEARDRRRRFPVVLAPVLLLLVGLTVLTHLPLVLIGLVAWFVLAHHRGAGSVGGHAGWGGHPRRRGL